MKKAILFFALLVLVQAYPALAKPDYSELSQGMTNFLMSLDAIVKELPTVNTATGTVQVINSWSLANEKMAEVAERFSAKYPEVYNVTEPPPEFAEAFEKIMNLKTDYATVPAGIAALVDRFGSEVAVKEAITRLQQSLIRVRNVPASAKRKIGKAEELLERGKAAQSGRDYELAITYWDALIKIDPDNAQVHYNRALAYDFKNDPAKALADYTESIRLDPANAMAYYNRGVIYDSNGDETKAITDYNDAIRISPNDSKCYAARGSAYTAIAAYDKAISDFTTAIQLDPKNKILYGNRAVAYQGAGELDRAISDYSRLIMADPRIGTTYYDRGNAYSEQGNFDAANTDFNSAVLYAPHDCRVFENRGFNYFKQGLYERAFSDLDESIRLDPSHASTRNNLAWCKAVCPVASFRNGKEAVENAIKACELSNWNDWHYVNTLAAAYAENANFQQAIKYQKQSMSMDNEPRRHHDRIKEEQRLALYEQNLPYRESAKSK